MTPAKHDTAKHDTAKHDTAKHDTAKHDTAKHDTAEVDTARLGSDDVTQRRQTRQRRAVDDVLAELAEFRTAQQIHDELRSRGGTVGLTTVYRRLQALTEAGQLDAIRVGDGETAYRRCSDGHHHHLVCRVCGRTVEVSGPAVEKWADAVAQQNEFREVSHDLEIFGTCQSC